MATKWTMSDGKTRDASQGPWVGAADIESFLLFCRSNGHETRPNAGEHRGFEVRHQGHWMGLRWNKSFDRYTADRRLTLIVQSFAMVRVLRANTPRKTLTLKNITSEKDEK